MIRITTFGEGTAEEVRRAVEAITSRLSNTESDGGNSERPKAALVLDLRGNAGGLLSAAVEVCDIFLDDGVIVSTKGRGVHDAGAAGDDAAALDVQRATRGAALADLPMAVLVDGLTASAAEVVAACLQDHGRAIVVGSRSFGKGTEQSIIRLSDGSGFLKLTTSEYLRPSRGTIHRRSNDDGDSTWGSSRTEAARSRPPAGRSSPSRPGDGSAMSCRRRGACQRQPTRRRRRFCHAASIRCWRRPSTCSTNGIDWRHGFHTGRPLRFGRAGLRSVRQSPPHLHRRADLSGKKKLPATQTTPRGVASERATRKASAGVVATCGSGRRACRQASTSCVTVAARGLVAYRVTTT